MECRFNKKYAFSLAEAMVMLVIIAIIMAMAAPLIAHKANADAKRLIFLGTGSNIVTAMGNNQNFGIGDKNPTGDNDAKLLVRSKRENQNLVAKFISNFAVSNTNKVTEANNAKKIIFHVQPKSDDTYVSTYGSPEGFKVFADGTTNAGCMPDYQQRRTVIFTSSCVGPCVSDDLDNYISVEMLSGELSASVPDGGASRTIGEVSINDNQPHKYEALKQGYILSSRCMRLRYGFQESSEISAYVCPPTTPYRITGSVASSNFTINGSDIQSMYTSYVMFPVSKGTVFSDVYYNNYHAVTGSINKPMDIRRAITFIPCKKLAE